MTDELQRLTIQLDADVVRMQRNLTKATKIVDGKLDNIDKRVTKSDARFNQWGRNVANSVKVGIAAAVFLAGKEAIATADKIDILRDRVKDATRESGGFEKVWKEITATAIETGSSIENNVELFQRLSIAAEDLGASNLSILKLNNTVQKLGILSGASTSALAAGTTQLAQGLGNGVLRAEEFNSIIENIPAVANAIAKSLGKSTAELRNMVMAGQVTSKQVFDALLASADEVDARFSEIPPRLSRAWAGFLTAISLRVDELNNKLEATETAANNIEKATRGLNMADVEDESILDNLIARWKAINGLMSEAEIKQRNLRGGQLEEIDVSETGDQEIRLGHVTGGDRDKPDPSSAIALREIEAMIEANKREQAQIGKTEAQIARMNAEWKIYNDIAQQGVEITDAQREAIDGMLDEFERQAATTERLAEKFEKLDEIADQFAEDFGQIFINSVANGENALEALGRSFKNTLIKMAADALIINPLKNLLSPKGGNLLGNLFGGFFADGGTPPMNKVSVVGEKGPEFFVPKTAGTIIPNGAMSGKSNIKIINQTTGRIDSVQQSMSRGEIQLLIKEETPKIIAGQVNSPNSSFNKSFRQNYDSGKRF